MAELYSVPTVARNLFRGMLTIILLGVCSFSILLVVVLILANNSGEMREKAEWCADYMPKASRSQCAAAAGW